MFITKKKLQQMIEEAKCAESERIHEEHYRKEEMNSLYRDIRDLRHDVDKINRELHSVKNDQEVAQIEKVHVTSPY